MPAAGTAIASTRRAGGSLAVTTSALTHLRRCPPAPLPPVPLPPVPLPPVPLPPVPLAARALAARALAARAPHSARAPPPALAPPPAVTALVSFGGRPPVGRVRRCGIGGGGGEEGGGEGEPIVQLLGCEPSQPAARPQQQQLVAASEPCGVMRHLGPG